MSGRRRADVLGAAEHMDVVDQQLDIARLTADPGDESDRPTDADEDGQLHERGVVLRSHEVLEAVEHGHVGGPHQTARNADGHDGGAQPATDVDDGARQRSTVDGGLHRHIVTRYVCANAADLLRRRRRPRTWF